VTAKLNYSRTKSALTTWGKTFVNKLKQAVEAADFTASRKTVNSIEGEVKETTLYIKSEATKDGKHAILELLDKGFRPKRPLGKAGIDNIVSWMQARGIQPRRKGRFVRGTRSNFRRAAFGIAREVHLRGAIKRYGNKGSDILNKSFTEIEPQFIEGVMGAYAEDVEEYLNNNTKRVVK